MVLTSMVSVSIAVAGSSWQKDDPSQWSSDDVYQILNNSPWSKSVRVNVAASAYGDQPPGNGGNNGTWGEGVPGGGMGRGGGLGGGGMGRGRGNRGGYPPAEQPTAVTVQWESALPVRLAEAKMSGGAADRAAMKPLNEYIVAVIGLPKSGLGSQLSTTSSGDDSDDARLADHLKVITVLSVGHKQLNPTKVELNQGRDGRTIFHFEKSEPITLHDKDAEFRIRADRMEIRKKFALKDMEYQGKLEL
jgi:hypothetical protein